MIETSAVVENGAVVGGRGSDLLVPWWSFTKTVLAAAALALVRDGALQLDAPLENRPYSLRQLLQHRSGLADYGGLQSYHEAVARGDEPWLRPTLLERAGAERLRYQPDQGWTYSNIGYLCVRQLIEMETGNGLNDALRRLVFEPLGVASAQVALEPEDLSGVEMGVAKGYHPGWVYHGLLIGSVEDAALLLYRLMTGDLLPPNLLEEMITPFVLPGPISGRPWAEPGYGLGAMCGVTTRGLRVVGHTGGGPGSTLAVYGSAECRPFRTAAFFGTDENEAAREERAFCCLTA